MRILVIGGNRFVGFELVWRLLGSGHHVTTLSRTDSSHLFMGRTEHIQADRSRNSFFDVIGGRHFDVVIDFALYAREDAEQLVQFFSDRSLGHYICISTGQVYLVRQHCPTPARETDYQGTLMPAPNNPADHDEWKYGIQKREAEDVLIRAFANSRFPATRLRLPIVNGPRDYSRRFESYLWRLLDGGPILLPGDDAKLVRQIYSSDVVRVIDKLMLNSTTYGEAYNLAQDDIVSIRELIDVAAEALGANPVYCVIDEELLRGVGLQPKDVSPFHGKWTSILDATKAKRDLRFTPTPVHRYVETTVGAFLSQIPKTPPANYGHRGVELALVKR